MEFFPFHWWPGVGAQRVELESVQFTREGRAVMQEVRETHTM